MIGAAIETKEYFIDLPQGNIFARQWLTPNSLAKEPIILIHDSLGCVELWRNFPEQLCKKTGRNVIAYDRLGYGRSGLRSGKLPLNFIVEEAEVYLPMIISRFGLEKFILFGHSVGGGMAVAGAGVLGNRCLAVITESAQAFIEAKTIQGLTEAKTNAKSNNQIERLKKYHGERAKWVFDVWIDTWLNPEFASWCLQAELPKVTCPLLAIHGDRDEYGSLEQPDMIRNLSGGVSCKAIIPDCGHIPHREKTETVLGLVADFLGRFNKRRPFDRL